jgi:hypothetical protein
MELKWPDNREEYCDCGGELIPLLRKDILIGKWCKRCFQIFKY